MIQISQNIYALDKIWNMDFDKYPLASFYNEYPFLIFENLVKKEKLNDLINSLDKSSYKARLVKKGLDEKIRKTILHSCNDKVKEIFEEAFFKIRKRVEDFFGVSFLKGTEIQVLEYKEGGFYKCHADNASEILKDGELIGYKLVKKERKLTTLMFLNDDFEGGELEFCHLRYKNKKRVIIKPKAGSMIVFPSHGLFAHEVKPVYKNNRYALVKWWEVI